MEVREVANWMLEKLKVDGCVYQDDVVDHLVKAKADALLRENSDGNLVVGLSVLKAFKTLTATTVVWVKSEKYWRFRVSEDDAARQARG